MSPSLQPPYIDSGQSADQLFKTGEVKKKKKIKWKSIIFIIIFLLLFYLRPTYIVSFLSFTITATAAKSIPVIRFGTTWFSLYTYI